MYTCTHMHACMKTCMHTHAHKKIMFTCARIHIHRQMCTCAYPMASCSAAFVVVLQGRHKMLYLFHLQSVSTFKKVICSWDHTGLHNFHVILTAFLHFDYGDRLPAVRRSFVHGFTYLTPLSCYLDSFGLLLTPPLVQGTNSQLCKVQFLGQSGGFIQVVMFHFESALKEQLLFITHQGSA